MKHLDQLLRDAVLARDAEEMKRLIRQGASRFTEGPDGQDATDLVFQIEDADKRLECRRALTILTTDAINRMI